MQIYTTRKINNQVDFRIVSKIIEILRKKSIDDDYLQIFKIERNKIPSYSQRYEQLGIYFCTGGGIMFQSIGAVLVIVGTATKLVGKVLDN